MLRAATRSAHFDRMTVINGLGVLDNPNTVHPGAQAGRPVERVDERSIHDALESGLTAVNLTVGPVSGDGDLYAATCAEIAEWNALIARHPRALRRVHSARDIDEAKAQGQIGVIFGMQNTAAVEADPERIAQLRGLGVRIIQLTYNVRNAVGDGATVTGDQGLTALGAQVIERLESERILVDLSHSSTKTCLDALASARRPVVISHSGCRAIADHPRNKSDHELRQLADRGGVIGIYFMPYLRLVGQPHAQDMLAHLEHAIDVCGEDHVGIGTDGALTHFDDPEAYRQELQADIERRKALGIGAPGESADVGLFLPDLCGPDQFVRLAGMLAERGHSEARIAKIMGQNFLRVMRECWGRGGD
jgi:membrane dipeptidase